MHTVYHVQMLLSTYCLVYVLILKFWRTYLIPVRPVAPRYKACTYCLYDGLFGLMVYHDSQQHPVGWEESKNLLFARGIYYAFKRAEELMFKASSTRNAIPGE